MLTASTGEGQYEVQIVCLRFCSSSILAACTTIFFIGFLQLVMPEQLPIAVVEQNIEGRVVGVPHLWVIVPSWPRKSVLRWSFLTLTRLPISASSDLKGSPFRYLLTGSSYATS
jgi:hypothetical protein